MVVVAGEIDFVVLSVAARECRDGLKFLRPGLIEAFPTPVWRVIEVVLDVCSFVAYALLG